MLTVPQIKRLATLSNAGLSDAAVGIVMGIYHDQPMPASTVAYYRRQYVGTRSSSSVAGLVNDHSANFVGVA